MNNAKNRTKTKNGKKLLHLKCSPKTLQTPSKISHHSIHKDPIKMTINSTT